MHGLGPVFGQKHVVHAHILDRANQEGGLGKCNVNYAGKCLDIHHALGAAEKCFTRHVDNDQLQPMHVAGNFLVFRETFGRRHQHVGVHQSRYIVLWGRMLKKYV